MQRLLQPLERWLAQLSSSAIFLLAAVLVAFLGWLDYATGFEISFSFFYLLPISLTAWYLNLKHAYFFTAVSILTWLISNWAAGQYYSSEWIRFFNALVRLGTFFMIAYLIHTLKFALHAEQTTARTDYLTGIYNKRHFITQLELELKRANRLQYPVSMVYIDLDNFKMVNDDLGHHAGDAQLTLIAQTISGLIRKTDLFARLGGDEFGLFLPDTDQARARPVLEKIERTVLHELSILNSPITLSMGVITFQAPPQDTDTIIKAADALMYQAKQTGKQQTIYHQFDERQNGLQ
jgi:diguanylate cyclase (GGDEF)-like protein